ncbi:MAG: hypothetical protein HIU84_04165 [Acidobacteria bacterium]|nr:hypothetical protein [Acidobacteriota bacterium]
MRDVALHLPRANGSDEMIITERLTRCPCGVGNDSPARVHWFPTHRHIASLLMWCFAADSATPDAPGLRTCALISSSSSLIGEEKG